MVVQDTVVAMELLESASAMLDMVVLIVLNLFAQIVKMETVVTMQLVCAKLVGKAVHAMKRHARRTVRSMAVVASLETACAPLDLWVFNVKQRLTFVPTDAMAMVCVMSGANNAIAMMDSKDSTVLCEHVPTVAMSQRVAVLMAHAFVHQTTRAQHAAKRNVQMDVLVMANVTVTLTHATVSLVGLDMTAASRHAWS